jgi:isopentenyldiphosphate isomerase
MEYWNVLDENGNKTGQTVEAGKVPDGMAHLGADVWIINSRNEVLIQKRSASKRNSPNVWATIGGSCIAGEDSAETILRETA